MAVCKISTEDKLTCVTHEVEERIDYIDEEIAYEEFFTKYMLVNKPCIFGPHATGNWPCRRQWVKDGKPNWKFLKNLFGDAVVPVAHCDKEEFSSHPKSDKLMKDYIDYWIRYIDKNYPKDMPCDYLKDWHCKRCFPECDIYTTPKYFKSDWLNEYCNHLQIDDYQFVYMGPKGSWTPFHADVMRSYSWSANICGQKRWILYPPGEENHLKNKFGQLPFDVRSTELNDKSIYPNTDKITRRYEVVQKSGEIIFVPSGWHHQVFNEEDTISLNHNWFNGCNVGTCWSYMKSCLKDVQNEINDCKETMDSCEWISQCQMILKASSGVNYSDFYQYLLIIFEKRKSLIQEFKGFTATSKQCTEHKSPQHEIFHWLFDLKKIRNILEDMLSETDFANIDLSCFTNEPSKVLQELNELLLTCVDNT